jgi:coenzyme F420-0:L-glutamate ligase/homotetrameric cytidine deaminase
LTGLNGIGELVEVLGIKTELINVGEDLVKALQKGMRRAGLILQDGDVLVISESVVATWQNRVIDLDTVTPSKMAFSLASRYSKDPREMELILQESDEIIGGIPGVVLTMIDGFLYPNGGIDHSNAPPGHVVLFPLNPSRSAEGIRNRISAGKKIGVIIGDSRTHPLRLGCVGVALGSFGLDPVEDARGQKDLYGRELKITRKAVADNLVSAAQIVMGEGDEGIPAAIIRDAPVPITDAGCDMPKIPPEECMYIGPLRSSSHHYIGGYDHLIEEAKKAMEYAYAPYSGFKVGAALQGESGRIYSAANVENVSSGADICAERAAIAKAVSLGERDIRAIAIVGDTREPLAPCGICRQNLIEFNHEIIVIMANLSGDILMATVGELLPIPFTANCLATRRELKG